MLVRQSVPNRVGKAGGMDREWTVSSTHPTDSSPTVNGTFGDLFKILAILCVSMYPLIAVSACMQALYAPQQEIRGLGKFDPDFGG